MKLSNLTYQQIQKIIDDCTQMIDFYNTEINIRTKQIYNTRKQLSLYKRKKQIYETFLKESKIDFTGSLDNLVDDISDIF